MLILQASKDSGIGMTLYLIPSKKLKLAGGTKMLATFHGLLIPMEHQ